MMRYLTLLLLAGLFFTSCGNDTAATEKSSMDATRAAQQAAYDGMMEGHDRVMPMMGKITAAQRAIMEQLKMDNLEESKKDLLEAANEQLEDANDEMMSWMDNMKSLDELRESMDNDAIITYIKQEAADIAKVETAMTVAIANANDLVSGHDHEHDGTEDPGHKH